MFVFLARHGRGVYLVGNGAASADVLDTVTARVLGHVY